MIGRLGFAHYYFLNDHHSYWLLWRLGILWHQIILFYGQTSIFWRWVNIRFPRHSN
jgi:hypothetical protein